MAQARWDARTDKNQQEIIDALREAGALVFYIKVPFDLLVAYRGRLYLMEVKSGKRGFSRKQAEVCKELMLRRRSTSSQSISFPQSPIKQ